MGNGCKGINWCGNKCIYLLKENKLGRSIYYVYDRKSLDGYLKEKCIDAFECIEGLMKLKEACLLDTIVMKSKLK